MYTDGRTPVLSPACDFVSTLPYIPGDTLALSFGATRSLDGITLDQVRRLADAARLPVKPVSDIVRETVDRTAKASKESPHRERIPAGILKIIDGQIEKVTSAARLWWLAST